MNDLDIAEIPFPSGQIRYRYARYLSPEGNRWVRHGRFTAFHENGSPASEGVYEHGKEKGLWRDFHPNGQVAAEGCFEAGSEVGSWRLWNADGSPSD